MTLEEAPPETAAVVPSLMLNTDDIVGEVAFRFAEASFSPLLDEENFDGALYVLSGFTPGQLVGFVKAAESAHQYSEKLRIQLPAAEMIGMGLPSKYLVQKSAVNVRLADRHGLVAITTDSERDVASSLENKTCIKNEELKGIGEEGETGQSAAIWAEVVSRHLEMQLAPELLKQIKAMMKGIFDCGSFPIQSAAQFLLSVLTLYKDGMPLLRGAGLSLPALDIPLFADCFASLGIEKSGQPSGWRIRFEEHRKNDCYLSKRHPTGLLLDRDQLRSKLEALEKDGSSPPISDAIIDAFRAYIEAEGNRSHATETLLFKCDWSIVRNCFDKQKKASSRDFVERTRQALKLYGVTTNESDEVVLKALEQNPRKSGEADGEFRDFREAYSKQIAHDPRLLFEWDDFVYGKRVNCTDLCSGIIEFLQRTVSVRRSGLDCLIVLEGNRQKNPIDFAHSSAKACEYFERHYGKLESSLGGKVEFLNTILPEYSTKVRPILDKTKTTKKKAGGRFKANAFEFFATLYEMDGGRRSRVATLPLTWTFAKDSILAVEGADIDALNRFRKSSGKTALAEGFANYETVGRKGSPLTLSLDSVQGFAGSPGASGRGSFIPAQTKIHSLAVEFVSTVEVAQDRGWISREATAGLLETFANFEKSYSSAIETLTVDALDATYVAPMTKLYRELLDGVHAIPHEESRRRSLRVLLRIGIVTVEKSGHRPKVAIVCPWHPLRLEAMAARKSQILNAVTRLLSKEEVVFSDGGSGSLFFREIKEMMHQALQPEVAVCWQGMEPVPCVATQSVGAYTLHEPTVADGANRSLEDHAADSAATIMKEVGEYLRLQPHERDNLAVLLYNCDSPELPGKLVTALNKHNRETKDAKITCQILLMHHDAGHLQRLYRDLVAQSDEDFSDTSDATGEFLSKVRINITAANRLKGEGRSQPVDIAYCRDLLSAEATVSWQWIDRHVEAPIALRPHQWNRQRPFHDGDRTAKVLLCCPAQTETGWSFLRAIATMCENGTENAWEHGKCPVLMRSLDFDNQNVGRILRETHDLAVWVVNQDELLDRRLLEQKQVKVIRYVQSTTQGRNLIISSKARDTLLVNTMRERVRALLPTDSEATLIESLVKRLMDDANQISGGLVLKAARRANNTSELFGMVLSRYLVMSELGKGRPAAWCFLDDYSGWLGKKEGANIADLLVLAPTFLVDGTPHLDIIVTEAKFVTQDGLRDAAADSQKQLLDTLTQISLALQRDPEALDQQIWLARISDMLLARTTALTGSEHKAYDPEKWRILVRNRECSFSVWGYSHVFVHTANVLGANVSECKGIDTKGCGPNLNAYQEIFGPALTRELLRDLHDGDYEKTLRLRTQMGHPVFCAHSVRKLRQHTESTVESGVEFGVPVVITEHDVAGASRGTVEFIQVETPTENQMPAAGNVIDGAAQVDNLEAFLMSRSIASNASDEKGLAWLTEATGQLRQAFLSRGLPAKLAEHAPVLTPNAAIIKLQGARELTVKLIEAKAGEIYTSDAIKIISVMPEPGRIAVGIERPDRQILYTCPILLEQIKLHREQGLGEKVFIAVKEEDGQPVYLDPLQQPHTLVAGITNSGKSVLIQNIIVAIAATRSPDDAQIVLIDTKNGVDYRPLDRLPHVQAGSGGIIKDAKTAINALTNAIVEMERRYELFAEHDVQNVTAYRKKGLPNLPTLWIIHDEFADWMHTDFYRDAVPELVSRLGIKARAAGIFLIFGLQRPDKDVMPMQLRSQLFNRLVLQVDNAATAEIAVGLKNSGAENLLGRGHMLAKVGNAGRLVYAQVPFIDQATEIPTIVELICEKYSAWVKPPSIIDDLPR